MFKATPNPPESDPTSSYSSLDPEKFHEATERALDYYLKPEQAKPKKDRPAAQLFTVVDDIDTESLLANLSENLASANAMISDLAFDLEGSRRHIAMGIQQVIEVSELLANRALDIADPR
ncbi:hypothetical protein B1219_05205 [Pseudomonas ogarae]|uniref:DUF6124 family protein n=1 Tax=Pseudomonas ogarae (strain DSM 112162 / CECT 30235 / F113) TaxID=1114970 RepID=UPI0009A42E06|nr:MULTISPECIES: DUF6124 family protein [Pseudomonas]OPG74460.1 hypothetical protein B1219_05205 [Pseudomonas ogarae]OPG79674.1 hypothetical protein B1218_09125 [Pseudomonas ogarae]PBJ04918.1 hypothetical protein BSF43_40900 [Pseudomonas ogarae]QXH97389.1 hypothetical protein HU749_013730 [Pseudomonas zarinae]